MSAAAAGRERIRVLDAYELVETCPNCTGSRWQVYGVALGPDVVHPVQCRCRDCGLVFASPRLTRAALARHYERYYSEADRLDERLEDARDRAARRMLARIRPHVARGRLLDVGAGSGAFMAVFRDAGYETAGVELSADGVEHARSRHGLSDVFHGTLEEARYPAACFDVVHAFHVVEHVHDLDGFLREVHRVLRRGGLLVLGTESYDYPASRVLRLSNFVRGRCPRTATSSEHTFVFSPRTLRDVCERRGFATLRLVSYDELSFRERMAFLGARSAARAWAARAGLAVPDLAGRFLRRGPYLLGLFERRR